MRTHTPTRARGRGQRRRACTRRRRLGWVGARHAALLATPRHADPQAKEDTSRASYDRRALSPQPSLEARREMADRGERAADDGGQRRASWSGAGFEEASGHDARGDGVDLRKNGGSGNRPEALGPRRPRAGRVRFKKLDLVFSRQSRSSELDSPIFSSAAGLLSPGTRSPDAASPRSRCRRRACRARRSRRRTRRT